MAFAMKVYVTNRRKEPKATRNWLQG